MAKVINLATPECGVSDGMELSFKAPCSSTIASSLSVDGVVYDIIDTNGSSISACSGCFLAGSIVTVILDMSRRKATLLNPEVNAHTMTLGSPGDSPSKTSARVWARVKQLESEIGEKASTNHTHSKSEITDFAHNHDDRYYTEGEVDAKLSTKTDNSVTKEIADWQSKLMSGEVAVKNSEHAQDALTLYGGTKITSGDLNDYKTEGNYYISSNDYMPNIANAPIAHAGLLKVLSGNGIKSSERGEYAYITQIFITHDCKMYMRHHYYHSWCAWKQFAGDGSHATNADNATHATSATNANHSATADNAKKVNDLEITRDANGVLRIGDTIIPQRTLIFSGDKEIGGLTRICDVPTNATAVEIYTEHGVFKIRYNSFVQFVCGFNGQTPDRFFSFTATDGSLKGSYRYYHTTGLSDTAVAKIYKVYSVIE